jgi:hypothetical protein
MENEELEVYKIEIYLITGIPTQKNPFLLTKNCIMNNGDNSCPFFIKNHKIPKDRLSTLNYEQQINFFFTRSIFVSFFKKEMLENSTECHMSYNIKTMIEFIFPTKYPIINNHKEIINTNTDINMRGMLPDIFGINVAKFSYITLDKKKYTVTSTCILNDIVTNPNYNIFLKKCKIFFVYKNQEEKRIRKEMTLLSKKLDQFIVDTKIYIDSIINTSSGYRSYSSTEINSIQKLLLSIDEENRDIVLNKLLLIINTSNITNKLLFSFREYLVQYFQLRAFYYLFYKNNNKEIIADGKGKKQIVEEDIKTIQKFIDSSYPKFTAFKNELYKLTSNVLQTSNVRIQNIFDKAYRTNKYTDLEKFTNTFVKNYHDKNDTNALVSKDIELEKQIEKELEKEKELELEKEKESKEKESKEKESKEKESKEKESKEKESEEKESEEKIVKTKKEIKEEEEKERQNQMYIGVNRTTKGFQSFVAIGIIDGILNDENMKKITCDHKNNALGKLFETRKEDDILFLPKEYITYTLLHTMIGDSVEKKDKQKGGCSKKKRKKRKSKTRTRSRRRTRTRSRSRSRYGF